MAYTKIFPIRTRLDRRVRYALNGKKTALETAAAMHWMPPNRKRPVHGRIQLRPYRACTEMYATKRRWARTKTGCRAITSSSPSGPER